MGLSCRILKILIILGGHMRAIGMIGTVVYILGSKAFSGQYQYLYKPTASSTSCNAWMLRAYTRHLEQKTDRHLNVRGPFYLAAGDPEMEPKWMWFLLCTGVMF